MKQYSQILFLIASLNTYHVRSFGVQLCPDTSKITSCKVTIPNRRSGFIQKSKEVEVSKINKHLNNVAQSKNSMKLK